MEPVTKLLDQRDPLRRAAKMAKKDQAKKEEAPEANGDNETATPTPQAPISARQPEAAAKDDYEFLSRGIPQNLRGKLVRARVVAYLESSNLQLTL